MAAPKILVVEDGSRITHILCFKLQQAGIETHWATDVTEGLAAAAHFNPDVIVSDFQLPAGDGIAFARALAASSITAEIPLILLTERGQRVGAAALEGTKVRYVLSKPFGVRDVLERVAEILPTASLSAGAC